MSYKRFFKDNREILNSYNEIKIKIDEFINEGNDVNIRDNYGENLLHYACRNGNLAIVEILLDKIVNLNLGNRFKFTPLHLGSLYGNLEVVKLLLLDKNVDINARDDLGKTPLHLSSLYRYLEISKVLLDKGADINAKDNFNEIPLHYSSKYGNLEITKMLVENGAHINALNYNGLKPINVAVNDKIKEYLSSARQMPDNNKIYPYFWVIVYNNIHKRRNNNI